MNNGLDSVSYLRMGYRVVGVEANPRLYDHSIQIPPIQVAKKEGRFNAENVGLWDDVSANSTMKFYIHKRQDEWSSFSKKLGCRTKRNFSMKNCYIIKVAMMTLSSLVEKYGPPFYMKIDIEGGDIYCLQSLPSLKTKPVFVSVEFDSYREEYQLLRTAGYDRFKIVEQSRLRPRSGAFGDFATDIKHGMNWRSPAQMEEFFNKAPVNSSSWKHNKELSDFCGKGCWYDYHAKIKRSDLDLNDT